jgi:hypothetical protein
LALVSFTPTAGQIGVNVDANLVITFSEPMVKASVQGHFSITSPATQVMYFWDTPGSNANGSVMTVVFDTMAPFGTITFDDLLTQNTTYTWQIAAGSTSATGNVLGLQSSSFTTVVDVTPPTVTSITPNPATGLVPSGTTNFVIVFDKSMDTTMAAVDLYNDSDARGAQLGNPTAGLSVTWTNTTTLNISLNGHPLTAGAGYRLLIISMFDTAGNLVAQSDLDYSVLVAGTGVDAVVPAITGLFPGNGQVGVSPDAGIYLGFTKSLTPNLAGSISVKVGAVTLNNYVVQYTLGSRSSDNYAQILPTTAWPSSSTIVVTITASGPTDAWGNHLAADYVSSFTTAAWTTNGIAIDNPGSSIKNAAADSDTFDGINGYFLFLDSTTQARRYYNAVSLTTKDFSVTEHATGIPVKGYQLNPFGGNLGAQLRISRIGNGLTPLLFSTAYDLTIQNTLKGSQGQTFNGGVAAVYTFTTVASGGTHRPTMAYAPITVFTTTTTGLNIGLEAVVFSLIDPSLAVSAADTAAGNSFSAPFPGTAPNAWSAAGPIYRCGFYSASGFIGTGVETITYKISDSVPSHTYTVDDNRYIFASTDLTALTLTALPPSPGATPTYHWTGTAPASTFALFLTVADAGSSAVLYEWVLPTSTTQFTQPADQPLTPGTMYTWTLQFFHSNDATLRPLTLSGAPMTPQAFTD